MDRQDKLLLTEELLSVSIETFFFLAFSPHEKKRDSDYAEQTMGLTPEWIE